MPSGLNRRRGGKGRHLSDPGDLSLAFAPILLMNMHCAVQQSYYLCSVDAHPWALGMEDL
jgi:hypothetical protein